MPAGHINGARLYHERHGDGPPVVLVHGSWGDATTWQLVVPRLAASFSVLLYDRRGHSRSERTPGQGSVHEDADDLSALLDALDLAPAHVLASSYGGNVALRLAAKRPDAFRSLSCHEPPLWDLLDADPDSRELRQREEEAVGELIAAGDHEGGARLFVEEMAFGPGAWEQLPAHARAVFVGNAPTFLDELRDPDRYGTDLAALQRLQVPLRLTQGSASPPLFARAIEHVLDAVPHARRETLQGAGHVPQLTAPEQYTESAETFLRNAEPSFRGARPSRPERHAV